MLALAPVICVVFVALGAVIICAAFGEKGE